MSNNIWTKCWAATTYVCPLVCGRNREWDEMQWTWQAHKPRIVVCHEHVNSQIKYSVVWPHRSSPSCSLNISSIAMIMADFRLQFYRWCFLVVSIYIDIVFGRFFVHTYFWFTFHAPYFAIANHNIKLCPNCICSNVWLFILSIVVTSIKNIHTHISFVCFFAPIYIASKLVIRSAE